MAAKSLEIQPNIRRAQPVGARRAGGRRRAVAARRDARPRLGYVPVTGWCRRALDAGVSGRVILADPREGGSADEPVERHGLPGHQGQPRSAVPVDCHPDTLTLDPADLTRKGTAPAGRAPH